MKNIFLSLVFLLQFILLNAQFSSVGTEFQVNSYSADNQGNPSVAMDAAGNFIIVWESNLQDESGYGIYAQRFNALGEAQGSEFGVNIYTNSDQRYPSVAMDVDGDFVVAWQSDGQDVDKNGIYARRYNSSGVTQGSEFKVNTYTTDNQMNPYVSMDDAGNFVIVWECNLQDESGYGIYAQRFNALGVAQGSEFGVNIYTNMDQRYPSVAMDSDGDFVVAWQSDGQDVDKNGIYARRYNSSGVTQGSEFKVNTYTTDNQMNPYVSMDDAGNFVIVWESNFQDGSGYGIYAQRYSSLGSVQGSEFNVNTYTTSDQRYPSVAMDNDGDFMVVWQSYDQDNDNYGIYAQRYNNSGVAQGIEFNVNTYFNAGQFYPSLIVMLHKFVVTWISNGQDGSGYGIYAQKYTLEMPTGIAQNDKMNDPVLKVYPNPAIDRVNIDAEGIIIIKISDLSGKVIREEWIENRTFSVSGLSSGIYLVEIKYGVYKTVLKLMVK